MAVREIGEGPLTAAARRHAATQLRWAVVAVVTLMVVGVVFAIVATEVDRFRRVDQCSTACDPLVSRLIDNACHCRTASPAGWTSNPDGANKP